MALADSAPFSMRAIFAGGAKSASAAALFSAFVFCSCWPLAVPAAGHSTFALVALTAPMASGFSAEVVGGAAGLEEVLLPPHM